MKRLERFEVPMRRSPGASDVRCVALVARHLRDNGPFDLVHGHSSKGGAIARLAALMNGIPSLYTPNAIGSMNPMLNPVGRALVGSIERTLARIPGVIIAVSEEEYTHLRQIGVPERKLALVPNAIPEPVLPAKREARAELGLPADATIIGFVGRLAPQKAPEILLQAFAVASAAHPDAHLAIVGTGGLEPQLRQQAASLAIEDRVVWLGERDGQRAMAAFDVFVLPSRYEGFPYVLLEALAAGLPIVTTTGASARALIQPGVNGLVVRPDRPLELAEAISKLLSDLGLRSRLAGNALVKSRGYRLKEMIQSTIAVYDRLLSAR
jgi:glycosyltransferase involved in cell wall biosynthesis